MIVYSGLGFHFNLISLQQQQQQEQTGNFWSIISHFGQSIKVTREQEKNAHTAKFEAAWQQDFSNTRISTTKSAASGQNNNFFAAAIEAIFTLIVVQSR
jgi:hypothetical protein